MKAMLLHELGGPVKPAEVPVPKVGPNDALLRLKATGVGLTVVIMKSTPGLVTGYPRILGHEVAGVVEEVGTEVQNVRVGERVTCHFYLTCHNCAFCRSGRETLCPNFRGFVGMACDGGYAEYMAVPALNLCPIPEELSLLDACVVADAVCTPYHACGAEGRVAPGEQVVIIGAGGGVGIHAVQMAQVFGGRVLAADISEKKLDYVAGLGAAATVNPARQDLPSEVKRLTEGRGADVVIDFVASSETLKAGLASLGRGGRLVVVGYRPPAVFQADPTFPVDPLSLLNNAQEIHGSRYVSMAELRASLEVVRQGKVKPIVTQTFPLEEAERVHQLIQNNEITGRAALVFE